MNNLLKDKVIVITGGAGLLGKEFVRAVVFNGGTAVIGEPAKEIGELAAKMMRDELETANVVSLELDITSKISLDSMIDTAVRKFGKVDALVNSAYPRNRNYGKKFEDVTYEDFCENLNLHLGGYFLASQRIALFFEEQGFGNVINISSIYGVIVPRFEVYGDSGMTMPVEYAAIKSAVIHLTKYMAKYFKGKNIRFNSLSPGGIEDGQPAQFLQRYNSLSLNKGMLDRKDVTGALIFLLSDMSEFVNGQNIVVDDGWSL